MSNYMDNIYSQTVKLDFKDVLIKPRPSDLDSRSKASLISEILKSKLDIETNGIIAANMDGVGTFKVAEVLKHHGAMTALHKHYPVHDLIEFFSSPESSHSFYSMGITDDDLIKLDTFLNSVSSDKPIKICVDVANGYMLKFADTLSNIRKKYKHLDLVVMGGNVVDGIGVRNISLSIDIAKLGIGPGSGCLTRSQTGIGYPQFSCVYDICKNKTDDTLYCSDGGCVTPGDISKALCAGADMVMLGGMLAGTDEGGGDIIDVNGRKMVEFYGMSSITAQKKHGGVKSYRASEGRTTLIPYKGSMDSVIGEILGCIRSTCTYVGARSIDELRHRGQFERVNAILNTSFEPFMVGK